jgi:hypothetical protein
MTIFLRLMRETDKAGELAAGCTAVRTHAADERVFQVAPESFRAVPGAPFAYWVSEAVRQSFNKFKAFGEERTATSGTGTLDDFRFLRQWVEAQNKKRFFPHAKGGAYSQIYFNQHLIVNWDRDGSEMKAWIVHRYGGGHWARNIRSTEHYLRPGLTWPRRTQGGLSFRAMPRGCIFADKGPAAFVANDAPDPLLALLALVNSKAFFLLVSLQMAFGSYEVGVIQRTPVPDFAPDQQATLASLARQAWSLKRTLDTVEETSHAFLLPAALRTRQGDYDPPAIEAELACIQAEIDTIAFDLYGFAETDRAAALAGDEAISAEEDDVEDDNEEDGAAALVETTAGLLSWAFSVAFGRFDIRLATGEREAPPKPEPFDPLPAKSPGMLPDGDPPFHASAGILVDDIGHPHDLPDLINRALDRVSMDVEVDTRSWLRREFFPLHLKQYSKSRRKAPIYWPLSTASGGYTLWLYYPVLTDQTLFVAANDFVGTKLERQVEPMLRALQQKTGRSRDEERELEELQTLHDELRDLRAELLRLAPAWKPNHDDGVQITAAPLWRMFRHRPWQTLLRETWEKLEEGAYDWAHLAMVYWPDRVREKCRTDKSLAIAHDLEHLYEPPPEAPAKAKGGRGRRKKD